MENLVSTITCVRCKEPKTREMSLKHSVYKNKSGVSTQRYICRDCQRIRISLKRNVSTQSKSVDTKQQIIAERKKLIESVMEKHAPKKPVEIPEEDFVDDVELILTKNEHPDFFV